MLKSLRHLLGRWELEVESPTEFVGTPAEVSARITTGDPRRAAELLEEAKSLYATAEARAESAERRATTLQGAVAVAATVAVAAATLLLDPQDINGDGWRAGFAALFIGLVYCLVATAYRAAQASSQVHEWHTPAAEDNVTRLKDSPRAARTAAAADYLYSYGRNTKIADWKVAYMRAASEWFARALVLLVVLALLVGAYVVASSPRGDRDQTSPVDDQKTTKEHMGYSGLDRS
jgi:hypothetical protein